MVGEASDIKITVIPRMGYATTNSFYQ